MIKEIKMLNLAYPQTFIFSFQGFCLGLHKPITHHSGFFYILASMNDKIANFALKVPLSFLICEVSDE